MTGQLVQCRYAARCLAVRWGRVMLVAYASAFFAREWGWWRFEPDAGGSAYLRAGPLALIWQGTTSRGCPDGKP